MIYSLYMERKDMYGDELEFSVINDGNFPARTAVAHKVKGKAPTLVYGDELNEYSFPNKPKKVERGEFRIFGVDSKERSSSAIGFDVLKNGQPFATYYHDAAPVGPRKLLQRRVGFDVIHYDNRDYLIFKSGTSNEDYHHYCVLDAVTKETVVILRRLAPNAGERRAYIYVESPAMEELAMSVAARELVLTVSYDAEGKCFDLSAGNYVSVDKEERDVYDADFVRRVEQSTITSY